MRIGIDLDGVVVDSIPRWVEVFNRESGQTYPPGALIDTYGTPHDAALSDRHELEMLIAPPPMTGAREALAALSTAGHELIVVTARSPRLRRLTEAWLDYYSIHVDALHFLEGGNKGAVAAAERLNLFVEDAPHNAIAIAGAGVPVLLFDAPYNQQVAGSHIRRAHGWTDIMAQLAQFRQVG